jgi:hypothetical protein
VSTLVLLHFKPSRNTGKTGISAEKTVEPATTEINTLRLYSGGQLVGSYTNVSNLQFGNYGTFWFDCGNEHVSARGEYVFSTAVK